jgi:hypothetical protein
MPTRLDLEQGVTYKTDNYVSKKFLLCRTCFWCASTYFSTEVEECPSCNNNLIESLPISDNEEYKFDYCVKRGIVLEFKASD